MSMLEVVLPAGDTSPTDCVTVSAIDDDLVEGNHTFDIVITSTDHPNITIDASRNTATITITDDDGMYIYITFRIRASKYNAKTYALFSLLMSTCGVHNRFLFQRCC